MKHLSCEQALILSEKLVCNMAFSTEDELAMLHVAYCDECYNLLQSIMALNFLWSGEIFTY